MRLWLAMLSISSLFAWDEIIPPGRFCPISSSGGITCGASILIWQSKMWGFEFAGKSFDPTDAGTSSVTLSEQIFVPDFAWRPGLKLDLGYDFGFDGWDLDSRWTYYKGEDTLLKKHFESLTYSGMGVVPLWFYPFYNVLSPNQIRFADGKMSWDHYFNSIDLEIGRSSMLTEYLTLHLFGGLKGAWMHQNYFVKYSDGTIIEAIVPGIDGTISYALLSSFSTFKNKSYGAGPRVGLDSKWELGCGISVVADAAFSLLYSKIETHRNQKDLNQNTTTGAIQPFHMHLGTNGHDLKPVMEAKLGFDWRMCFYTCSIMEFAVQYEVQLWWGQNVLRRNYSHAEPGTMFSMMGDLQMHGLTAKVGYAY